MTNLNPVLSLILLVTACSTSPPPDDAKKPIHGHWDFEFQLTKEVTFSQTVAIDSLHRFTFINGLEHIQTRPAVQLNDTLYIEMPVYKSHLRLYRSDENRLTGSWHHPAKGRAYAIPVTAKRSESMAKPLDATPTTPLTYQITFSPNTPDAYPAEGIFRTSAEGITGTFRTETGDYRYLSGSSTASGYSLGCFDGSHLFQFEFTLDDDSIRGTFHSGSHWSEPFVGYRSDRSILRDPFSITYVTTDEPVVLELFTLNGDLHVLDAQQLNSPVTILQIMGTWCPNCLDEARYLIDFKRRYGNDVGIIGLAFERSNDVSTNLQNLTTYVQTTGINYPLFLAGSASKSIASDKFPMLNRISSFPTTLVIDGQGAIVAIHTGFNGPSTGEAFERFKTQFEGTIDRVLALSGV